MTYKGHFVSLSWIGFAYSVWSSFTLHTQRDSSPEWDLPNCKCTRRTGQQQLTRVARRTLREIKWPPKPFDWPDTTPAPLALVPPFIQPPTSPLLLGAYSHMPEPCLLHWVAGTLFHFGSRLGAQSRHHIKWPAIQSHAAIIMTRQAMYLNVSCPVYINVVDF